MKSPYAPRLEQQCGDVIRWVDELIAKVQEATVTGIEQIAAERARHADKGWTDFHDDRHDDGALALAAVAYAGHAAGERVTIRAAQDPWPWASMYDKRLKFALDPAKLTTAQRIELLAIAGSLLAAEIDRLQRLVADS